MATAKKGAQARGRIKRANRKNISVGQAHIKSTFNNTIISIDRPPGQRDLLALCRHGRLQGLP